MSLKDRLRKNDSGDTEDPLPAPLPQYPYRLWTSVAWAQLVGALALAAIVYGLQALGFGFSAQNPSQTHLSLYLPWHIDMPFTTALGAMAAWATIVSIIVGFLIRVDLTRKMADPPPVATLAGCAGLGGYLALLLTSESRSFTTTALAALLITTLFVKTAVRAPSEAGQNAPRASSTSLKLLISAALAIVVVYAALHPIRPDTFTVAAPNGIALEGGESSNSKSSRVTSEGTQQVAVPRNKWIRVAVPFPKTILPVSIRSVNLEGEYGAVRSGTRRFGAPNQNRDLERFSRGGDASTAAPFTRSRMLAEQSMKFGLSRLPANAERSGGVLHFYFKFKECAQFEPLRLASIQVRSTVGGIDTEQTVPLARKLEINCPSGHERASDNE